MINYIPKSKKSPDTQRLINEALDILDSVGISVKTKSERAKESMAMSFLAVAGIVKSWSDVINVDENRIVTTREIIRFINEHYEENISPGSYDDIRRKHLNPLVITDLIENTSKTQDAAAHDPRRGYSLNKEFKTLIVFYGTKDWYTKHSIFLKKRATTINIPQIHDKIFEFLANWSDGNSLGTVNPYFYLRTKEDERFKKGYWFPGDENYLAISFWTGGDALNKTPNIYINIAFKKGIDVCIVARDSENKKKYFEKIISHLSGYQPLSNKSIWRKSLSERMGENFIDTIQEFIQTDKVIIDNLIYQTLVETSSSDYKLLEDEYSSKFGLISKEQFYKLKSRVEFQRNKLPEEYDVDELPKDDDSDELPIALTTISIEKFQGIEKATLEDLPTNSKWIFLTGENGFGKTSVLQAIALGVTNYDENREYIRDGAKIDITYKKGTQLVFNSSIFSRTVEFKSLDKSFIAYGPLRLNSQASSSENQESRNSSNIYNLFNKDGLLKNVNYLFKASKLKDNREFVNLKNAIIQILDNRIDDIRIDTNGEIQYYETDRQGNILGINRLEHLATGFQSLINLTGDIISRFSKEFPLYNYSDYEGIILIDELENHLHPIFQKKLPELLSNIFPKIQFITSVHSPIPLLGAPVNSVILKVNRDAEKQITIERIIIDNIETLNPNILFTSPIFGFSSIISNNLVEKGKLRTEDTWDEVNKNDELDKELLSLYNARKKKS